MAYEIIRFTLADPLLEKLQDSVEEGESLHLAAKRLISNLLESDRQSSPMPPDIGDRLGEIEDHLERLENRPALDPEALERLAGILARDYWGDGQGVDRLQTIEARLEKFEKHLDWAKREILDQREKIKSLESDAYWNGDKKTETAIMVQKQPFPPELGKHPKPEPSPGPISERLLTKESSDIPLKTQIALRTEIARTHEEVALAWEKSVSTVRRWAKDPDKWPEGWLWDGDKNFWVKKV